MPREGWRENYRCVTHVWLTSDFVRFFMTSLFTERTCWKWGRRDAHWSIFKCIKFLRPVFYWVVCCYRQYFPCKRVKISTASVVQAGSPLFFYRESPQPRTCLELCVSFSSLLLTCTHKDWSPERKVRRQNQISSALPSPQIIPVRASLCTNKPLYPYSQDISVEPMRFRRTLSTAIAIVYF